MPGHKMKKAKGMRRGGVMKAKGMKNGGKMKSKMMKNATELEESWARGSFLQNSQKPTLGDKK